MMFCWYKSRGLFSETEWLSLTTLLVALVLFAKIFKTIDHYRRNCGDLLLLPVAIAFGYFHGLIKLYALCSLSNVRPSALLQANNMLIVQVTWGSRDTSEDKSPKKSAAFGVVSGAS
jgi:hypothetical protein